MKIFAGAEHIISPLGTTAEDNFLNLQKNISGINLFAGAGFKKENINLSKITSLKKEKKFDVLLENCVVAVKEKISDQVFGSAKTIVVISTTKGNLDENLMGTIINSAKRFHTQFAFKNFPLVISNACASGVIAITTAANLIRAGTYNHAIVIGCDVISDFVLFGFQSLFAISDEPCAPFDKNRKGISLGEGCAALVLSNEKTVFNSQPVEFICGSSSNDANHISGPSRTGEGLYRTVKKTIEAGRVGIGEIDFISAHGTATLYNDDMESVAFDRLGMNEIPLNSLKGYFGHTLGAAGVIEVACCIQSMKNNLLIKNIGFKNAGTPKQINVLTSNQAKEVTTVLKTASGFGGCNASLLLRKL